MRPASGLVRDVTAWQVFGFNVMNANIGIGLVWLTLLGPALYPGANLYLAVLLAFAGILPLNLLYVRLAAAFPRSGGDYVSISRTLHPALGFAVNVAAMAYFCLFVGLGGLYTVQYGLTPLARVAAAFSGSPAARHLADRLSTPTGTFLVSLAVLVAYALLMIRGGRLYFRVQSAAFVLGTAALAAVVIAGLLLSRGAALAHIDTALARLHAGPISRSPRDRRRPSRGRPRCMPPSGPGSSSWAATSRSSSPARCAARRAARRSACSARSPGRSAGCSSWSSPSSHLFGQTLFANLAFTPPAKLGLASTPAFAELVALALHHEALAVLLLAAFTVWGFAWVGPTAMCVSRCLFAWSLDGLAPRWCAEVHRRWHTPYRALLLTFAAAGVFTALMIYAHLSLLSGMIVMFTEWLCVAAVAIVLPVVAERRAFVLPPARRVLGLSTLSWLGVLTVPPVLVAA